MNNALLLLKTNIDKLDVSHKKGERGLLLVEECVRVKNCSLSDSRNSLKINQ